MKGCCLTEAIPRKNQSTGNGSNDLPLCSRTTRKRQMKKSIVIADCLFPHDARQKLVRTLGRVCMVVCLMAAFLASADVMAQQADDPADRYVTIDFNDVDINLFIKYISELTGKNFIVDRTVKGKVTIISPTRISEADAYYVFESVLEVHGFTTVPSGSVIKIIPSVQARSKSIETIRQQGMLYPEDKVVTQLIPLTHTDPEEVKRLLAPLVSKTSVVIAHTDSGMLIVTDFLSNINRLQEIIQAVDVPSVGEELIVIPLEFCLGRDYFQGIEPAVRPDRGETGAAG